LVDVAYNTNNNTTNAAEILSISSGIDGMTRAQAILVVPESSPSFFKYILNTDPASRATALAQIVSLLRESVQALREQSVVASSSSIESPAPIDNQRAALILVHLPWLVRAAYACPFDDVRTTFAALIQEINEMVGAL
jgi:hypothetical protein